MLFGHQNWNKFNILNCICFIENRNIVGKKYKQYCLKSKNSKYVSEPIKSRKFSYFLKRHLHIIGGHLLFNHFEKCYTTVNKCFPLNHFTNHKSRCYNMPYSF